MLSDADFRSTCDAPTYVDNGNGTVTSSCCHLTWEKTPEKDKYTYPEAEAHCSSLALAGGGWRVPTLAELLTIVSKKNTPAIDPTAFPGSIGATAWSSTQHGDDPSENAGIQFSDGIVARIATDRTVDVRCVR